MDWKKKYATELYNCVCFYPRLPIPHNFGPWLVILNYLFDPLLLFYVAWPSLSLQPERLLIKPVQLFFERHIEPSKGFLLNVNFWVMFKASPERLPAHKGQDTCVIPQPGHLSVSSKGEDNKVILSVTKMFFLCVR